MGSWNVAAQKREGSELQTSSENSVRRAEGHMRDHTCIQQVSSGGEPSKDSEREHPGEE